ncbi:hypothetical protein GCM10023336_46000 [Streptomyces similanensis]|uniref:Uncharacterized protein n=1 Tax=Streptomyces similanensis TaxID=1274988 RepID=A0ABP9KSX1_9ACTN
MSAKRDNGPSGVKGLSEDRYESVQVRTILAARARTHIGLTTSYVPLTYVYLRQGVGAPR